MDWVGIGKLPAPAGAAPIDWRDDPKDELRSPGAGGNEDGSWEKADGPLDAQDKPLDWKAWGEGPMRGLDPRLSPANAVGLAEPGLLPNRGMLVRADEWLEGDPPLLWEASNIAGDMR